MLEHSCTIYSACGGCLAQLGICLVDVGGFIYSLVWDLHYQHTFFASLLVSPRAG